jgi:hypothetical protein
LEFFSQTANKTFLFNMTNIALKAQSTANFTVTNWRMLNSISRPSVTAEIASGSVSNTYELANGQSGTSFSSESSTGTATRKGGIPEFPRQLLVIPAFTLAIMASYIAIRRHSKHVPCTRYSFRVVY